MSFFSPSTAESRSDSGFRNTGLGKIFAPRALEAVNLFDQELRRDANTDWEAKYRAAQPQLGLNGLFAAQNQGFFDAANYLGSKYSASQASRGQIHPESGGNIVGSATRDVMMHYLPLIGQQVYNQGVAPIAFGQQARNQWLGLANANANAHLAGLGQTSTESRSGQGMGYTLGNSFLGSLGENVGKVLGTGGMSLMGMG